METLQKFKMNSTDKLKLPPSYKNKSTIETIHREKHKHDLQKIMNRNGLHTGHVQNRY